MNKLYIYISIIAGIVFTACTKDFEEINTNPNSPVNAQSDLLMRQVIYDFGENMSYEGYVAGNLLGQHFTKIDFNLFDRHDLISVQDGGNPWPFIYENLRNNEILLNKALEGGVDAIYEGPARIMKAYMAMILTDLYGDVPYFEAFKGKDGIIAPKYDKQEDIYQAEGGIIWQLNKAIEQIDAYSGTATLGGDIIYNGNLSAWKKMANSLKIKALVKISGRINVASELQSIVNDGNYIMSNSENAIFNFTNSLPNSFRIATLRAGDFGNFILSETMDSVMESLNDPRVGVLFRPTENNPNDFNGLRNGPDASNLSISVADYSLTGTIFRENTALLDCNFITAWETGFLLAEAAQKGLISADAKSLYDNAVNLAFEYWSTDLPSEYLNTGNASFAANGQNPLEQIITQKWIANSINGYEPWVEWRRTGFPAFKTVTASFNNDIIPVRMPYPQDEAALNASNYNEAASNTNGNSINAKVWWDVD